MSKTIFMNRIITPMAIVGVISSSLAFNSKKCDAYCVAVTSGGTCNVLSGVTRVNTGKVQLSRFAYATWDGTLTSCNNGTCTFPITLYAE